MWSLYFERNYDVLKSKNFRLKELTQHYFFFFSIWVFFYEHSRITGLQGKGEGISLTPQYHFHPLHRHLDISRAFTAESSPLHIVTSIIFISIRPLLRQNKKMLRSLFFLRKLDHGPLFSYIYYETILVGIGFSMNNKRHILSIVYTMLV